MKTKTSLGRMVPRTGSAMADTTHVEVAVFYDKGGANYFTGGRSARGYWVRVLPVKVDGHAVSFTLFDKRGFKRFLKPAARFNARILAELAARVDPAIDAVADAMAVGDGHAAAALLEPFRDVVAA